MTPSNELNQAYHLYHQAFPTPDAIEKLGKLLATKLSRYPSFLEDLCAEHKDVSMSALRLALEVGRGALYAPVALSLWNEGVKRVMCFQIEDQKKLFHDGVMVLVNGKAERIPLFDLNLSQIIQVFARKGVRNIEQQRQFLGQVKVAKPANRKTGPGYTINSKSRVVSVLVSKLTAKDIEEIAAKLLTFQEGMFILQSIQQRLEKDKG